MTGQAAARSELRKLAHALDVPETALSMVDSLSAADLRTLRVQIGEALFQADKPYFARVAALSKMVPVGVAAKLTEIALPPLLAARTTELLEPHRAAELVTKISPAYLSRVAAYLDASRAPEVVAAMPTGTVAAVAQELARKQEWVVIGSFVSVVGAEALGASVAVFDGEQLLRIGFVLDDLSRLDDIGTLLTDQQIDQLLAAAPDLGLWTELDTLLSNLSAARIERMAARLAQGPESVRAAFDRAGQVAAPALAVLAP